MAIILDIDNPY